MFLTGLALLATALLGGAFQEIIGNRAIELESDFGICLPKTSLNARENFCCVRLSLRPKLISCRFPKPLLLK